MVMEIIMVVLVKMVMEIVVLTALVMIMVVLVNMVMDIVVLIVLAITATPRSQMMHKEL